MRYMNQILVLGKENAWEGKKGFSHPKSQALYFHSQHFQRHPNLPSCDKGFGHPVVPAAIAGRDKVSHPTALKKGSWGNWSGCAKGAGEGYHLHEAQPDHRCLGVVSKAQAVTEACTYSHHILRRARKVNSFETEGQIKSKLSNTQQYSKLQ